MSAVVELQVHLTGPQLVTADLTSIIVQLITTAGSLLPSVKNSFLANPVLGQLESISGVGFPPNLGIYNAPGNNNCGNKLQGHSDQIEQMGDRDLEQNYVNTPSLSVSNIGEHVHKDEEDAIEGENFPLVHMKSCNWRRKKFWLHTATSVSSSARDSKGCKLEDAYKSSWG